LYLLVQPEALALGVLGVQEVLALMEPLADKA